MSGSSQRFSIMAIEPRGRQSSSVGSTRSSRSLKRCIRGGNSPWTATSWGQSGKAAAEALFELSLVVTSSIGHDAVAPDGRKVEITATYGRKSFAIRGTSDGIADALIVLRLSRSADVDAEVVFNGPVEVALEAAGPVQSNGQSTISITRLRDLDKLVTPEARLARRQPIG